MVAGVGRAAEPSGLAALGKLAGAPGVVGHSGPYPVTAAKLQAAGRTSDVQAVGRDAASASVDQPRLVAGGWVGDGGVVVEAAFANALDVRVGDPVTLNGRSFEVVGVAVTAAMPPYPGSSCIVAAGCVNGVAPEDQALPPGVLHNPGLVWLTQADVRSLAPDPGSLAYVLNLKLADPDGAQTFADANQGGPGRAMSLQPWNSILEDATELARDSQILLLIGAWGLALVGGWMADQTRRVGLLKAVGGTPGLVAAVLLAEYLLVAVVPALRAARSSTVSALADSPRPPRRVGWLIAISARLPVPLLLALRIAARRPRRVVLAVVSIAITVSGIFVVLVLNAFLADQPITGGYDGAQVGVLRHVLPVWTVILLCLAAVNAVVITWATVLDNRHSLALARARRDPSRRERGDGGHAGAARAR
ncbi:ABC transporter permease [Nonomuraea zeae]|uniref:ABC transporter permease n=1 Tax=Nonomuraea zeae TaxID=1642303 RepID=UPI00197DCC3A|nr:ABC transporter permease [Nonomuraea zeae]